MPIPFISGFARYPGARPQEAVVLLPLEAWPLLLRVNAAVHRHVSGASVSGVVGNVAFTELTVSFRSRLFAFVLFVAVTAVRGYFVWYNPPLHALLFHYGMSCRRSKYFARCVYSLHASLIGEAGTEAGCAPRLQFLAASHYSRCNLPSFQRWIFSGGRLRAHPAVPEQPKRGLARLGLPLRDV
jgi:hypothetical protein